MISMCLGKLALKYYIVEFICSYEYKGLSKFSDLQYFLSYLDYHYLKKLYQVIVNR